MGRAALGGLCSVYSDAVDSGGISSFKTQSTQAYTNCGSCAAVASMSGGKENHVWDNCFGLDVLKRPGIGG